MPHHLRQKRDFDDWETGDKIIIYDDSDSGSTGIDFCGVESKYLVEMYIYIYEFNNIIVKCCSRINNIIFYIFHSYSSPQYCK